MRAGKRFCVVAAEEALGARVVAGGGADGIGGLLGDGAAGAGADPAPARGCGALRAHAGDEAGAADAAGRQRVAGGDGLGDGAVGGVLVLLVKVEVFAPKRGCDWLALGEELEWFPLRNAAAGFHGVERDDRRIGGERGGAGVVPAAGDAFGARVVLTPDRAGLEGKRERNR